MIAVRPEIADPSGPCAVASTVRVRLPRATPSSAEGSRVAMSAGSSMMSAPDVSVVPSPSRTETGDGGVRHQQLMQTHGSSTSENVYCPNPSGENVYGSDSTFHCTVAPATGAPKKYAACATTLVAPPRTTSP